MVYTMFYEKCSLYSFFLSLFFLSFSIHNSKSCRVASFFVTFWGSSNGEIKVPVDSSGSNSGPGTPSN